MEKEKNTNKFSKLLLVIWAILLVVVVLILVWTAVTSSKTKESGMEAEVDIRLNQHTLKRGGLDTEGHTASLKGVPSEIVPIPAYKTYAAEENQNIEGKVKVAFVFTDLGINENSLKQIIEGTPPQVSLSFFPFAKSSEKDMKKARKQGREVLLCIPMEPNDYPQTDPGPHTLLTGLPEKDNIERLDWALSQGQEYVGVVNYRGSLFLSSSQDLTPILEEVDKHGLAFVESMSNFRSKADHIATEIKMPYLKSHFVIGETLTFEQLGSLLTQVEQASKKLPLTVIVAHASPRTVPFLVSWIQKLEGENFAFVPVSQALQILSQDTSNPKPTREVAP